MMTTPKQLRYSDDATKARNMMAFHELQSHTVSPITAPVLTRLLKMHRQYEANFESKNEKFESARQFFRDFEADYSHPNSEQYACMLSDMATECEWKLHMPEGMPFVYWHLCHHDKSAMKLMPK